MEGGGKDRPAGGGGGTEGRAGRLAGQMGISGGGQLGKRQSLITLCLLDAMRRVQLVSPDSFPGHHSNR